MGVYIGRWSGREGRRWGRREQGKNKREYEKIHRKLNYATVREGEKRGKGREREQEQR